MVKNLPGMQEAQKVHKSIIPKKKKAHTLIKKLFIKKKC